MDANPTPVHHGRRARAPRALLLGLLLGALALTGCSDDEGGGDANGAGAEAVSIADFAFDPDGLTVAAGSTVTFTNEDGAGHTATAESFDTGELEEGDTAEVTLDEPGEITYFCDIHNYMTGTITVE